MTKAKDSSRLHARQARIVLAASFVITLALYWVPFGRLFAWPLVIFSTLVHEMGHGIAALLIGGRFEALLLWSDGSGVATWSALVSRLGYATIAAGGLIGPAVGAAVCLIAGRRPSTSRLALATMAAILFVAEILVVRTLFGVVYVGLVILVFAVSAGLARPWFSQLLVVFVGVQLALSVFSRGDYLFTERAHTGQGELASDTAQIAEALILPYWFWGGCVALFSIAVIFAAFLVYLRED